jgi:DNA-directed RNA polymerase subunit RPC12/RpoP
MALFRNYYRCALCGEEWTDEWSATCDDDCPHCGARHMSPHKSEEIGEEAVDE